MATKRDMTGEEMFNFLTQKKSWVDFFTKTPCVKSSEYAYKPTRTKYILDFELTMVVVFANDRLLRLSLGHRMRRIDDCSQSSHLS